MELNMRLVTTTRLTSAGKGQVSSLFFHWFIMILNNCSDRYDITRERDLSWQTAKEDKPPNEKTTSVPIIGRITSAQCTVPP